MSDLGETLMILDFEARTTSLNIWLPLRIFSILSDEICVLVDLLRYGTLMIFKYDFDWNSLRD